MASFYQIIKSKRLATTHHYTPAGRLVAKGYAVTLEELPRELRLIPRSSVQLIPITTTDAMVKKHSEQPKSKI